jgi:hypothetical protein
LWCVKYFCISKIASSDDDAVVQAPVSDACYAPTVSVTALSHTHTHTHYSDTAVTVAQCQTSVVQVRQID